MDQEEIVECSEHGPQPAAFVCEHLAESVQTGVRVGFHCAGDEDLSDAWCDACEWVRQIEGGWNENSEKAAGITLICGACYELARATNMKAD